MKYSTIRGDILDAICTAHYGLGEFDLALVLAANIGLARLGPVLPSGIIVQLPEATRVQVTPQMIRLVD